MAEKLSSDMLFRIFDCVGVFSEGVAWVRQGQDEFHIREDGTPLYPEKYAWAGNFKNGHALVCSGKEVFFINCKGQRIKEA